MVLDSPAVLVVLTPLPEPTVRAGLMPITPWRVGLVVSMAPHVFKLSILRGRQLPNLSGFSCGPCTCMA